MAKMGNLPDESSLNAAAAVCNLAIGQGELLASPIALLNLYSAIANGGVYPMPTVVETGEESPYCYAMSEEAANLLKEYLINAQDQGTGRNAKPKNSMISGGKTATAQTGRYSENKEILIGWYCGFAEIGNQKYTITILREEVSSGASDCAPLFAEICDGIYSIFYSK